MEILTHESTVENDMQKRKSGVLIEEFDEQDHVVRQPCLDLVTKRTKFTESTTSSSRRAGKRS